LREAGSRTDVTLLRAYARYFVMRSAWRSDEELLAATAREPEAFGVFYRRHGAAGCLYLLSEVQEDGPARPVSRRRLRRGDLGK
jgi:hypothetical protein